jgi:ectoine hydroxylase-related dioxygenase (phytanoyl-CoA dioxygenase family)
LHGYAILPNIFPHNEISEVVDVISQSQLKRRRAGARHILTVPAVSKVAEDLRLLSIAREVLGQTAIPFRATLFDKSSSSNWLVAWHQDTALPLVKKTEELAGDRGRPKRVLIYAHAPREALEQVLAPRVQLDDSESANGPLKVIPETHYDGVIAMRPLIIRASSKTKNDCPRRILHIEYASRIEISNELRLATV